MAALSRESGSTGDRHDGLEIEVNGVVRPISPAPGATLLDVLRGELRMSGTKLGCGRGECGACTVLIDGEAVYSCLTLVARVRGHVETIEGLSSETQDLRAAFADAGAFQCGFCTPGQVVRAAGLLRAGDLADSDEQLRHEFAGNICRCTGYQAIVEAVRRAALARNGES